MKYGKEYYWRCTDKECKEFLKFYPATMVTANSSQDAREQAEKHEKDFHGKKMVCNFGVIFHHA